MRKFRIEVVVVFLIIFLFLIQGVSAFQWVTGYVKNSTNGISPDGSIAEIYCNEIYTLTDYIGNGTANQSNWYMFDIESLSDCYENETIYSKILPNNTFYSGPINTLVVNGSFQMPNMTFNQPPVLQGIQVDKQFAETDEIITITTTNWHDPNGDGVRLKCYHSLDWLILPSSDLPESSPLTSLCNSDYGTTNRTCGFTAPSLTDGEKEIYCKLDDGLDNGDYNSNYNSTTFILDNTDPVINDIQMTSDIPQAFYVNNSFNGTHIVVMFNSIAGSGANQNVSITVQYNDISPDKLTGNDTFGNTEQVNNTDTNQPTIIYNIPEGAGQNLTLLTVYDKLNHTTTAIVVWINTTDITSQDNVPEPIYWYNFSEINITINVTSVWDIQNTTYCVDNYDFRITSSHYNEYCNPKTNPDGTETYSIPSDPKLNITLTCPENTACQKVLRYYSTTTGNLKEEIIRTSNPINIITGSSVANKTASFTQIYPVSAITNSTNFNVSITNSLEANSNCENLTIFNSEIINTLMENSNTINSYLFYSNIYDSPISNSSVALSNITNSTILKIDSTLYEINVSYISNSNIEDSTITNSRIYSSFIDPSIVIDSYISNTTITNATVRYSRIEDSIICPGMDVNSAAIDNNIMSSGKIIFGDKTFYGPYNITLICENKTTPFPIGEITYSPDYPTSYVDTTTCYHAYDIGYNVTLAIYDPGETLLVSEVQMYDDGNETYGDELANDAIYCIKGTFSAVGGTTSGNYTIEITEKDNLGNINKANFTILVDNTEPLATIRINNGESKTTTSDVTLNLGYSDEHSGIDSCAYYNADPSITPTNQSVCEGQNGYWTKFSCNDGYYNATSSVYHCCLPEEQFTICSPTKEWVLTFGYGTRTVWYQVKDRAENTATTIDSILLEPNAPVIISPLNNSFIEGNISILAYAPDDTTNIYFYLTNSTDNILIKHDSDGSDGWTAILNTTGYPDAQYYLKVIAYEGGTLSGSFNITINIDNTHPNPPSSFLLNNEAGTDIYDNDGNVSFLLTSSSSNDIDYYNIYKSDLPDINLTSGNIYRKISSNTPKEWYDLFQDGIYYFTATGVDYSGKESVGYSTITLTVDTQTPIGELTAEPTTISNEGTILFKYYGYETGLNVFINSSELQNIDSTATTQVNLIDNGTARDLVANDGIYTGEYVVGKFNSRDDGNYLITATVNDSLGNLFYPKVSVTLSNTCKYSGTGDWTITDTQICENKNFTIDGIINIMSGGSLLIRDSTFTFDNNVALCDYSNSSITRENCSVGMINRYGVFNINDSTINVTNTSNYIVLESRTTAQEFVINNSIIDSSGYLEIKTPNSIIENSELSSYDSDVIYLYGSENSIVKNNNVYFNAPLLLTIINDSLRGAAIKTHQSSGDIISNNIIYSSNDTAFVGIQIGLYSDNIEVYNNQILKQPYESGIGIYGLSSSILDIYQNNISETRDYGPLVQLTGTGIMLSACNDSEIHNNFINGPTTSGIWITSTATQLDIYNNQVEDSSIGIGIGSGSTENTITANNIINSSYSSIYFGTFTNNNYFYNMNLEKIKMNNGTNHTNEYFVNCTINNSEIYGLATTNRSLHFGWYLDANVKDNESNPIKDVEVKFRDNENTTLFTKMTDEDGNIEQQAVYEYKINKSGIDYFTPLKYYATKHMYQPTYGNLNITTNYFLNLTLLKLFDEQDYPTPATIIDEGEYTNKDTDLEFWFVNASDYSSTLLGIPLKYNYSTSSTGPWTQTEDIHIILGNSFNDEDTVTLYVRTINPYGMYSTSQSNGIIIDLTPPSAPDISSPTHPDNTTWYADNSPILNWNSTDSTSGLSGYSYVIDKDLGTLPDQIIDAQGSQLIAQSSSAGESVRIKDSDNGNAYLFAQKIDSLTSFNTSTLKDGDKIKTTIYLFEENGEVEEGINFTICLSDDYSSGTYTCIGDADILNYDVKYPSGNNPDNAIKYSTTIILGANVATSELYLIVIGENTDEPTQNISLAAREYDSNSEICDYDGTDCILSDNTIKFKMELTQEDSISKEYSNLGDGIWYFHVRAVDVAGNWGEQAIYKLKINTLGAGAYITKPVSGAITYMNTTTVKGIVTATANITLYINNSLVDSQLDVSDEFEFVNIDLAMGTNKIFIEANDGDVKITSNIVYITRVIKPEYELEITLVGTATNESDHIIYATASGGEYIIGLATEKPDDSTEETGGKLKITAEEDGTSYLIISNVNKETQIQQKETFLNQQTFLDLIEPSFGGLKATTGSEKLLNLILTYDNIIINANDESMSAGRHTLIIKNNGYTSDGSVNITVEIV